MPQNRVVELFGTNTELAADWESIVRQQKCPFTGGRCFKIRKSDSATSIGTCTVRVGQAAEPLLICPNRLLEGGQVFADCLHLLARHQPGNELHVIPEVSIPGGSVDYFLVTASRGKPVDFVGIEFQTMDTTGTVWPARQEFLRSVGLNAPIAASDAKKPYGVNWKMTAKTILMQLHHKIETFEALGRNFVLVVQNPFMDYMKNEFDFGHLTHPAVISEPMHFHSYGITEAQARMSLHLRDRFSTNAVGIAKALNLGSVAIVDEARILETIASKMSSQTRWSPVNIR